MLKIFFTGANSYLAQQRKGLLSLGGFISDTPAPNDYLNGVFSKVSQSNKNETRFFDMVCLALRNDFALPVNSLSFWVENQSVNPITSFEASFILPAESIEGLFFEKIDTRKNKPIYANFQKVNLESEKIVMPTPLLPKNYVGLWIKRNILQNVLACVPETEFETLETLKFNFKWE